MSPKVYTEIYTDTEIINILLDALQSRDSRATAEDILKFIKEKRALRHDFPTLQDVMDEAELCIQLFAERANAYGDSWKDVRLTSLIDYVTMKYHRVNKMAENPIKNFDKTESDLRDMINYGFFSLIKLHELKEDAVSDQE